MELWREILSPDFLLRNSVYVSVLVGFVSPLVGVFLVLRRMIFLGVALPQVSSAGVALALALHVWLGHADSSHGEEQQNIAFAGSLAFSFGAIACLAFLERRGRGLVEGRLGAAFVIAASASLLLLAKCPTAEQSWLGLLKGEIIAVSNTDLIVTLVSFALVVVLLLWFRREFLLVSFDRELALVLRKRVGRWDLLLYLLMGTTIGVSVLTVGPLVSFGFLLLPALIARAVAANVYQFMALASLIGGAAALGGFYIAYRWDLPVGPTDIALMGILYGIVSVLRRVKRSVVRTS